MTEERLTVRRGVTIDGVGTVRRVRNLVRWRDRLGGKYHTHNLLQLVTTTDGARYKMVTLLRPGGSGSAPPPTVRAARLLQRFDCGLCVPALRYVDNRRLIVDFIAGRTLEKLPLHRERIRALARFIASSQPGLAGRDTVSADFSDRVKILADAELLHGAQIAAAEHFTQRLAADAALPAALCFCDSALKNYVERPDAGLTFIDVFGIKSDLVGASMVRQVLSLPAGLRRAFLQDYLAGSAYRDALYHNLPGYCVAHLVDRVLSHIAHLGGVHHGHRTRARNRHRTRVLYTAVDRLQHCLQLPDTSDAFSSWLTDASV